MPESILDKWYWETGIHQEQSAKNAPRKKSRPTMKLAENGKTCKDCKNAVRRDGGTKYFYKCFLMKKFWTCGTATDIRLRDAACAFFEEEKEEQS